jgi:hypothetical protein
MVRGMGSKKFRANTMAFYAIFLVTVGIPMMALCIDASRVMVMKVRLREATEAACQAYANSLDVKEFIFNNELVFNEGMPNAMKVFTGALKNAGTFVPVQYRKPGEGAVLPGGKTVEIVVIQCYGTAMVDMVVPLFEDIMVTTSASAKTKFSTAQ